ncbi:dnaJ homolog subfamily C member 28 [Toxorhynchites rutilus septentrionalis]|uniref:dnaJ homolog subfamily C member 28 n=1 Tax=Toxorhynchites rutilus septentrionalis TaxID=329112 RepID=UPI0024790B8D|nr:dnaJ homolog subfamily C member 28 [Toxorhynchites rutilus septentrionalis]XP_055637244.1 dnaJ homolog subfamily C member 28 [Toxorhynchites rutilus septentrionalis]XP_055637245.1 dnaJ homolog subfamily C member 28 [Toxorhynchites rutilus septentrionalis]
MLCKNRLFSYKAHFGLCIRNCYTSRGELYNKCYRVLGVTEQSDQNTVRQAYIALVKKFHPDSGNPEASAERFHELDNAFRILQEKFSKSRRGIIEDMQDKVKVFDIRHTAPQHRQYLTFDGVGMGTPAQRQKQYQTVRAQRAQERVLEHRMSKAQATEMALMKKGDYYKKHEIKTKYGYDRVVEDLIQEAMSRGDFSNLSGFGKPLPDHQSQNPYVDFTTHKINKIMLDNGFTPEWITLHKEIKEDREDLTKSLTTERQSLGAVPLNPQDEYKWTKALEAHENVVGSINKKIDKFNLIVPVLNKQMMRVDLKKLSGQILEIKQYEYHVQPENSLLSSENQPQDAGRANIFSFIGSLLK